MSEFRIPFFRKRRAILILNERGWMSEGYLHAYNAPKRLRLELFVTVRFGCCAIIKWYICLADRAVRALFRNDSAVKTRRLEENLHATWNKSICRSARRCRNGKKYTARFFINADPCPSHRSHGQLFFIGATPWKLAWTGRRAVPNEHLLQKYVIKALVAVIHYFALKPINDPLRSSFIFLFLFFSKIGMIRLT